MEINITKRKFYFLVLVGVFVLSGFFVYAYNSGASPAVMGHSGEEIQVSVNGETKLLNDAFDDLAFSCPSGFTLVESQGYVLGCIQNDEEGSADAFAATDVCFTQYGGRLPEVSEWFLGLNNYDLLNEIDDYEWTEIYGGRGAGVCGSGGLTVCDVRDGLSNTFAYRCFIPTN